jgi:hypothetical protein
MMCPPLVLAIRLKGRDRKSLRLWLPVVVLWPTALALGLALAPVALIVALVARGWRFTGKAVAAVPRAYTVLCALRGVRIDVGGESEHVYMSIS